MGAGAKQRSLAPFLGHFLQLREIVPPACPRSSWGHLTGEAYRRWSFSHATSASPWASQPFFNWDALWRKVNSATLCQYPQLVTIPESTNVDWLGNQQGFLSAKLLCYHERPSSLLMLHRCCSCWSPIPLFWHSRTRTQYAQTPPLRVRSHPQPRECTPTFSWPKTMVLDLNFRILISAAFESAVNWSSETKISKRSTSSVKTTDPLSQATRADPLKTQTVPGNYFYKSYETSTC